MQAECRNVHTRTCDRIEREEYVVDGTALDLLQVDPRTHGAAAAALVELHGSAHTALAPTIYLLGILVDCRPHPLPTPSCRPPAWLGEGEGHPHEQKNSQISNGERWQPSLNPLRNSIRKTFTHHPPLFQHHTITNDLVLVAFHFHHHVKHFHLVPHLQRLLLEVIRARRGMS